MFWGRGDTIQPTPETVSKFKKLYRVLIISIHILQVWVSGSPLGLLFASFLCEQCFLNDPELCKHSELTTPIKPSLQKFIFPGNRLDGVVRINSYPPSAQGSNLYNSLKPEQGLIPINQKAFKLPSFQLCYLFFMGPPDQVITF